MRRLLARVRRSEPSIWPPAAVKSPKPHIRVMSRDCGNPDCTCQQQTAEVES